MNNKHEFCHKIDTQYKAYSSYNDFLHSVAVRKKSITLNVLPSSLTTKNKLRIDLRLYTFTNS